MPDPNDKLERLPNGRFVRWLTFRGKTKKLADWCRELRIARTTLIKRLNDYGWSVEKALSEPIHARKPFQKYAKNVEALVLGDNEAVPEEERKAREKSIRQNAKTRIKEKEHFKNLTGETKWDACHRLKQEGRYLRFRQKCAEIKAKCQKDRDKRLISKVPSRTAIFYMALKSFPPLPPVDDDG